MGNTQLYKPKIIDNRYAAFLVELKKCSICSCFMVVKPSQQFYEKNTFPIYHKLDFKTQADRAHLHIVSNIKIDNEFICIKCAKDGKATFLCALCNKRKSSNKEKEIFGDPPEVLCIDCYETVSAKIWDDKCKILNAQHRYDFE